MSTEIDLSSDGSDGSESCTEENVSASPVTDDVPRLSSSYASSPNSNPIRESASMIANGGNGGKGYESEVIKGIKGMTSL